MLLAAFALVVVLLQILAVSRLSVSNSPPRPWEYEYYYDRAEKGERRTTPLEHVSYLTKAIYLLCLFINYFDQRRLNPTIIVWW